MARTRAMSPAARAPSKRPHRPWSRYDPAEYAAAPPAAQTRKTPAKTTQSAIKTVKGRSGLADDRASTATGGNAALRAKVLAAVLRLARERNRGEAGIGHSSIRSYLLKHGENPKAKGTAERIRRIKLDLMDQGVLVKGWSSGSTIAVRKGIDTQVNKLCDVQDPDSSDDERACSAYLASRLDRSRPSTRSRSKARSRTASKKTVKKRRTHADVDDTASASDETDYDAPPRPAHDGTGKGEQPAPATTQRKRSSKKVRVAEPEHDEEGSDIEGVDAGDDEDGPRTRSKGKKVVKRAASGKGSAGARGRTSRLTKAQLVAQVEELRRKEDERGDEVEDLREKLTEMSEVNQTWEARARVLGYRDEDEELGVGEVDEEEDAQQPAPEQDVRIEDQPDDADEGAQELNAAPVVKEPDEEHEDDEQDLGGMDQPFFADDVDLDAELERAGWPQPPQPPAQEQHGQAPSTTPFAVSPSAARPFAGAPYFPQADASRARGTSAPPRVTDLPSTASASTDDPAGFDAEYPRLSSDNEDGPTRPTGATPVKGKGRMLQDASPSSSPAAGRFLSLQLNPHSPRVDLPAHNVASSSSPAKSEAGHLSRFGGYGARATTPSQPSSPLGTSPPPTVRGDPYRRVVELEREVAKEREREQMLKEDMEGILRRHHEMVEELAAEKLRLEGTVLALRHKRAAEDAASTARLIPALKVDAPVNLVSQAVQTPPLLDPSAQLTASALRIAQLEGDLARTTTRASELDKKLEESEAAYDALLESDRAKQEQAKLDMRKIATLESALAKEQGEREKERAARARAKDETKASLEARLKEVKAAHDKLAFDLSRVRSALAAAEADRDLQVKNADVAHEEKGAALAARDRIAGDVVKIKNELELAKHEIRRRNEELTSAAAQIQQLEASQLSRAEEHTQPDQRAVTAYTHDVAELQGRIEDLEALKRDADRKAQADADLEEMRSELRDLRSRLNDVEGDRTEAERGRVAAECKVLELERGVETAGASVSAMVTEKAALAAELAEIEVRLESIVTEKMTVESRIIEHAVKAGFLAGPATAHSPPHAELVELLESLMLRLHSREDVVKRLGDERDQQADLLKSLLRRANELLAERTVTDPSTSGTLGSEAQTDVETALKLVGGKLASLEVQLEQTSAWKADAEARALVIKDASQTLVELEAVLSAAVEAETPDSAPVQQDLLTQVKRATILAMETASRLKQAHEALAADEAKVAAEEAKVAAVAGELAQAQEEIKSKDGTIADAQASLQASFAENERLGSRMSVFKRFCDAFWEEDAARAEGVGGSSVSQTASGPAGGAGGLAQ